MKNVTLKTALITLTLALALGGEPKIARYDIPMKGEKELDVELNFSVGTLDIRGGEQRDYILRSGISYFKSTYKPIIDYKILGEKGKLKIYSESSSTELNFKKRNLNSVENHWRLEFPHKLPIGFDIELGLGEGNLDFTNLDVNYLSLECGMSDVTYRFDKPNKTRLKRLIIESGLGEVSGYGLLNANISRFEIECGLGSTELYFDGISKGDIKGDVTVGLGSVEIKIPRNIGVEVETESSFLSTIDLNDFDELEDDYYRSENWDETEYKIYLNVSIGLGSVDIDWIDD